MTIRIEDTRLFQRLTQIDKYGNMLAQISSITNYVTPLLARIPEKMPEYTLHDASHSLKIIDIIGRIIPYETFECLNEIEISLLILAAYIHDIGMTCSSDEREEIILHSSEFKVLLKSSNMYPEYVEHLEKNDHREATRIEDRVFTEYLRKHHVKRSAEFISRELVSGQYKLTYFDIPIYKSLIDICDSHGVSILEIRDTNRWSRDRLIEKKYVNIQYLSIVFRLADILDLDPERTPEIIYDFVAPSDTNSVLEWRKHKSIIGWDISPERIVIESECSFPEVERTLRIFINAIESERRESVELLIRDSDQISKKYKLLLVEPITTDRIRSDGTYIYSDVKFELHYKKVIDLLMGQKLYRSPIIGIRELMQNSLDAIKARQFFYSNKLLSFIPKITLHYSNGKLIIEDNGIGMDDIVFSEFFLQVGKSYYNEPVFKDSTLDVVSEFGIGVLSTFMIAQSMIIESRMEPFNPIKPPLPIHYEIPTAHSFCIKRDCYRAEIGTRIELLLKDEVAFEKESFLEIIEAIIPNPPFPIDIYIENEHIVHDGIKYRVFPIASEDMDKSFIKEMRRNNNEDFLYCLFKINLDIEENLKGIIQIVNTEVMNFSSRMYGSVTQRYFSIGGLTNKDDQFKILPSEAIQNLFPKWTSVYSNIDIFNKDCLSITPDRTDVIIDEKYLSLKIKIESLLIEHFKQHLDNFKLNHSIEQYNNYTDFLLRAGFVGAPNPYNYGMISQDSRDFLLNYFTFSVISPDGMIVRKFGKDIKQKRYIGVVESLWSKEYINILSDFCARYDIEIIVQPEMDYDREYRLDFVINHLFGFRNHKKSYDYIIVTSLPGLHINVFDTIDNFKMGIYDIVKNIGVNLSIESNQILCVPSNSGGYYHIFNRSHPFISPLFSYDSFKNKMAEVLLDKLREQFSKIFYDFIKRMDKTDDVRWVRLLNRNSHALISVRLFKNDPNMLNNFIDCLDLFWGEMIKEGFVDRGAPIPEITEMDFPPYWS